MKRLGLIAAMALSSVAPTIVLAQQVLNLRDADIRAFIQDAARVTGRTFIIDARVAGKVSVVTDRPLSRSEYFEVFLSTLRANGLVAVPTGNGAYRIQPVDGVSTQPGRVGSSGAARNSFVTEIFRLRAIDAAQAVETVRPLVSREGSVTANAAGNSLVVADYADNIRRIRSVIARIDSDTAETRVVPLRNAGAREIATALQTLSSVGGPRGTVAISPVDSSNAIALRGDARAVARLTDIIADLDRRAAAGSEIRVVFLQHADAEKLLPVLQTLVGQTPSITSQVVSNAQTRRVPGTAPAVPAAAAAPAASGGGGTGVGHSPAIIARYEGTNAIIISASADVQRTLGEVIRQLDTRREQVLVEAIIVEISDTAARKLGIQLAFGGPNGGAFTTYSNVTPPIVPIAGGILQNELSGGTTTTTTVNGTTTTTTSGNSNGSTLLQGALSAVNSATGGTAGAAFGLGNNLYLGAIINAVSQDNQSNLLSTPSVVQRQNVGIQLEVKPQIGEGGAIKLFLRQEVSSIAGAVTNNSSDLILNKREIQTTMTVDDGQIMAIGGLLDDNERRTLEKVPVLGDIPLFGELFRSRSRSRGKTNLMVFIRPTILRTAADAKAYAERRYGYVRSQQLLGNPDQEPSIDELMRDYMGVQPPGPVLSQQVVPGEAPPPPQIVPSQSSTQVIHPARPPNDK